MGEAPGVPTRAGRGSGSVVTGDGLRSPMSRTCDFAIVTALPTEREALLGVVEQPHVMRNPDRDIWTYHTGQIGRYDVVAVTTLRPGNPDATRVAADVIAHWAPRYLVMIGIAGGVPRDGLALGDVVVADQIIEYDYEKEGDRRWRAYLPDALLLERAREMSSWRLQVGRRPDASDEFSKVWFGPIATGSKVVASAATRSALLRINSRILAFEMEAGGISIAAWQHPRGPGVFVVRGISDLADEAKSDLWQSYAARAAALFLQEFLLSGPVPRSADEAMDDLFDIGSDPDNLDAYYRRPD